MSLIVEWQGAQFRAAISDVVQNGGIRSVFGRDSHCVRDGCCGSCVVRSPVASIECRDDEQWNEGSNEKSLCDCPGRLLGRVFCSASDKGSGEGTLPEAGCGSGSVAFDGSGLGRVEKSRRRRDVFDSVAPDAAVSLRLPVEVSGGDRVCLGKVCQGLSFGDFPCVEEAVVDGRFGDSTGSSVHLRGVRYERNRRKRQARKQRRSGISRDDVDVGSVKSGDHGYDLKASSVAKWKAQNELEAERARRELEVLRASDVNDEIRQRRAKITAATERQLVSIEKTHAQLVAAGNVPGEVSVDNPGSVETVMTPGLSSGSISPNSSASMAQYWAALREVEDLKATLEKMKERTGLDPKLLPYFDKDIWTDNSENHDILGQLYPVGYGMNSEFLDEGKFRPC